MNKRLRNLGFLIKDVARLSAKHFERHATELGLTLAQCKALVMLSHNEGVTQAKLAEYSDTDPMTLVRIIDRMEGDGWVERRPDPQDRRAYQLYLKPAAAPVLEKILQLADKARGESLSGFSNEERMQLVTLLERLHANLNELVSK
jgi:DNA-binding MarR family transcriptional regulator